MLEVEQLLLHGQLAGLLDCNLIKLKIFNKHPEIQDVFFGMVFGINFISLQNQKELMAKNYFYIILLSFFFSFSSNAQEAKALPKTQDTTIDGLSFYPNPVSNGKIYITSKSALDKEITIFDVLGKKVLQTLINSKELNIGTIPPGVYIIKIREGEATATRKLIVR